MLLSASATRSAAATVTLLSAFGVPLGAQADSVTPDTGRRALAPLTIGVYAPVRSIGSLRWSVDSSDVGNGARARTLSELIQGRLPGVSVLRLGGDPSDGSRVRVRGTTSLVGDAAPLVILDGVPVNTPERLGLIPAENQLPENASSRLDDFEPEEIERLDLLPGPAATTLFGAGASNGAIVITTKRGATGPPRWRVWSHGALSGDPTTYPANYRQNGTNPSTGAAVGECNVTVIADGQCTPTTLDVWNPLEAASPFRTGRYGAAGASVAGGPFGIRGFASATGRVETGVLDDSRASRLNGRLNAERELFGRLTIGGSLGYVARGATARLDNVVLRGILGSAVDDEQRGYLQPLDASPLDRRGGRLSRSARFEWLALPWLRVHGTAGRDELTQRDLHVDTTFNPGGPPLRFTTRHWLASSIGHVTAEARHEAGGSVALRTLISFEESRRRSVAEETATDGNVFSIRTSARWRSIRGWMVQERIGIADRLFLNLGARLIDGERSDDGDRWHPSLDAAWDVGALPGGSTLRLRGAYAVGVQPRDTNSTLFFVAPPPLGDPQTPIEPEEPREAEIGFDGSIARRVALNATFFDQRTPKLIVIAPFLAPSAGGSGFAAVLGKMENRGVELAARFLLVDRPAARWAATMTLATLRNRVNGIGAVPPSFFQGAGVRDGQPFGVFLAQDVTFADANGDNLPSASEITVGERHPSRTAIPTREASLRTELGLPYPGLVLRAALDHRGGHRAASIFPYYQCGLNRSCRALEDPSASLPDKVDAVAAAQHSARSVYLQDASYTRVAELAVEWTPAARLGRVLARGVTIAIEARNLATWTSFDGPDPEVATANMARGFPPLVMVPALPRTVGVRVEVAPR